MVRLTHEFLSARARRAIGGAILLAALALAAWLMQRPLLGDPDPIDLTAPVVADEQCSPCHTGLGGSSTRGVRFSHSTHTQILIRCDSCHWGPPHAGGETVRPKMQACFNCHGLTHLGTDFPSGQCTECHTKEFELRPKDHGATWKLKPHADASRDDANRCVMCHDAEETCDPCHYDKGVILDSFRPRTYQPVLPESPDLAPMEIDPYGAVKMSQCYPCHRDIDSFDRKAVILDHATHLGKDGIGCEDCHERFVHRLDGTDRVPMQTCYKCHGLYHSTKGLVATEKCEACHPKAFELKPANHTKAFEKGAHKDSAKKDPSYCTMCHASDFCVKCHDGRRKQADGSPPKKVVPADHKKATWKGEHGGRFMAQEGQCGSCHDAPSCKECHKTPMPHPPGWLAKHEVEGEAKKDCEVCHKDRDRCQTCHHDNVKSGTLVMENCVGCHEEMRIRKGSVAEMKRQAASIKNKGFAEHAVHFFVDAEGPYQKERPYTCLECHIKFGTSRSSTDMRSGNPLETSHDLRLCYDCHGSLDFQKIQIAPYPGRELCMRCHRDLRF